jgi:hypothetical protein
VVPHLKAINPALSASIINFAKRASLMQSEIKVEALKYIKANQQIKRKDFLILPSFLQKEIIKQLKKDLYSKHIDEVIAMIEKGVGNKEKHGFYLNGGVLVLR